jgi:hypothetical protein
MNSHRSRQDLPRGTQPGAHFNPSDDGGAGERVVRRLLAEGMLDPD